jgi:hypothetical protein
MLSRGPSSDRAASWSPPTFDEGERRRLKRFLWLAITALVVVGLAMVVVGEPMTGNGGRNIVAFELAESGDAAQEIMDEWGSEGRAAARWSLILDYVWLIAYTAILMIGLVLIAEMARERDWRRTQRLGWLVAGLALLAGLLDAVENTFLLVELANGGSDVAAFGARLAATFKFLFVAASILYLVVVGIACFFRRPEGEQLRPKGEQAVTIAPRTRPDADA